VDPLFLELSKGIPGPSTTLAFMQVTNCPSFASRVITKIPRYDDLGVVTHHVLGEILGTREDIYGENVNDLRFLATLEKVEHLNIRIT
jgi:hypothetical protein